MRARLSFIASLLLVLLVGVAAANAATGGSLTSGWSESSTTMGTRTEVPPVRVPAVPPRAPARSSDVSASTSCVNDVCTVCVNGSCKRTGVPEGVADAVIEAVPRELPEKVRDLTDCLRD